MVPVNSTVASERAFEALLRRREEKMALSPINFKSPISETNATSFLQGFGPVRIRRIIFFVFWKGGALQRDAEVESFKKF